MESKKYLSKKELWMFAVGAGGQGMIYAMMSSYVSDYYVNVLQLPLLFVLLLMLLARVWDAINDPLMGMIVDRHTTKWGTMKPYILFAAVPIAILTFVATLIVVVCSGTLSLIAFFALYLGESIMFPTIFSLALRDAGTKTKLASSLLIMTIVGGAVAPVIMGYIADITGSMAIAFLIPLVCYGVIGGYAAMPRCSSTGVERD